MTLPPVESSRWPLVWKRTKSLSFKKGVWSDEGRLPSDEPLHWGKLLSAYFGFWWYSMDFQQDWSRETWELTWSDEGPTRQGSPYMPGQWSVSIELKREENLGKPLFEMCWFYMGIAQIALDPSSSVKRANVGKKVPQTILASIYTPPPLRSIPIWK